MSDTFEFKPFTNSSDLDFEFQYDGKKYMVPAGKTKIFAAFLVDHAAKHFIDREIIRKYNVSRIKSIPLNDKKTRDEIYSKCVSDPAALAERITNMTQGKDDPEPEPVPAEPVNPPIGKKAGRPKKEVAVV